MMAGDEQTYDITDYSSSLTRGPSWSFGIGSTDKFTTSSSRNQHDCRDPRVSSPVGCPISPSPRLVNPQRHQIPVNIQIPTVYLTKRQGTDSKGHSTYHVYQIIISTMAGETWSIYRRYSQFHSLHHKLKAKDPKISKKLQLPPKRRLNSKSSAIVQDRRTRLEEYLNSLCHYIATQLPTSIDYCNQEEQKPEEDNQAGEQDVISENAIFTLEDVDGNNDTTFDNQTSPIKSTSQNQDRTSSVSDSTSSQDRRSSSISAGQSNDVNLVTDRPASSVTSLPDSLRSTPTNTGGSRGSDQDLMSLFFEFLSFSEKKDEILDLINYDP